MNDIKVLDEEIILYDKIIDLLEWTTDDDEHLYNEDFPIMMNGKRLFRVCHEKLKYDETTEIPFMPLYNYKQTNYLLNVLYDDDSIEDIKIIKTENRTFSATIINKKGFPILKLSNFQSEIDAIIVTCYAFIYRSEDLMPIINRIRTINNKLKKNDKSKGKKKKGVRK